jgi:hypothetical protein
MDVGTMSVIDIQFGSAIAPTLIRLVIITQAFYRYRVSKKCTNPTRGGKYSIEAVYAQR